MHEKSYEQTPKNLKPCTTYHNPPRSHDGFARNVDTTDLSAASAESDGIVFYVVTLLALVLVLAAVIACVFRGILPN